MERAKTHRLLNVLKVLSKQPSNLTLDDLVESDFELINEVRK